MYTQKLRQYDAGIVTLGHTVSPTHIIPPGQKWNTVAHCTKACTEKVCMHHMFYFIDLEKFCLN